MYSWGLFQKFNLLTQISDGNRDECLTVRAGERCAGCRVYLDNTQLIFPYKLVFAALKHGVTVFVTPKRHFEGQKAGKKAVAPEPLRSLVSPHLGFTISLAGSLDYFWDIQHFFIYILLVRLFTQ